MSAATAVADATTASSRIPPGQSSPTPPHTPPDLKAGNWQHGPPGSPTTPTAPTTPSAATTTTARAGSTSHGSTDVGRNQEQHRRERDAHSIPTPRPADASRHFPLPPPCPRHVSAEAAAPFALILEAAERVSAADHLREATTTAAEDGTVGTVGTSQHHDNHRHHNHRGGSIDDDARLAATANALSITVGRRQRGSDQSVPPSSLVGGHLDDERQPLQQLHRRAHPGSASTMSSTAIDTSPSVSAPSTSGNITTLGNPAALTVVPASQASGRDERKPALHTETPNHRSLKRNTPTSFSERQNTTTSRIDSPIKRTAQIRSVAAILANSSVVGPPRLGGTENHQHHPASETRDQNDRGEYGERAVSMYQRQLPPPVPRRPSDSPATPAGAIGQHAKETRNDEPWTPLLVVGASNHPISHMRTPTANPQRSPEPEPLQNHREYHYTHQPPHQQQHPPSLPPLRPHTHSINSPPTQQPTPSEVDSSSHTLRASEFSPADSSTSSRQSPSKRRRSSAEKPNKRARGPQEHICDECGRKFPYASKLRDHMMIHSPNKDCRCPVPDCTKIFKRPREVSAHCRAVHKNVYRSSPPPPARRVSSTRLEDTTPTPTPPNSIPTPPVPRFDQLSPRRYQSDRTDVIQQQPTPNSDGSYEVRSPAVHIKSDPEDGDRQLPAPDRRIEYDEPMGVSPRRDSISSFRRLSLAYSSPTSPQGFVPPADEEDMSVELPPIPESKSMQSPSTTTLPGISELANLPRPQIRRPPESRFASIDHVAVRPPPPELIDQDVAHAPRSVSPKSTPALLEMPPRQDNSPPPGETPTSPNSPPSDPENPKNPEATKINDYLLTSLFGCGNENMGGQT